jgi:ATP-binding cassette subfamily B protein/subfamily B ATP-binding cassette protein MsbA
MSRYRQAIPYIARQWRALVAIALVTVAFAGVGALEPWPLKLLLDHALTRRGLPPALSSLAGASPPTLILVAAVASVVLFAAGTVLNLAIHWLWAVAGQRMVFELSTALFHRLQRLSLAYHARTPVGDSLSRLAGDSWCLYGLASKVFSPIEQLVTLGTMGAVAWQLDRQLALLLLAAAPVLGASSAYFGPRLKTQAQGNREGHARLTSLVHQTLAGLPMVQAFTAEQRHARLFSAQADELVKLDRRAAITGNAYGLVNGLATAVAAAIILYVGGRRVMAGALSVGSLVVFLAYARKVQLAAENLLRSYGSLKPVEASLDRVFEILAHPDGEVRDSALARALPARPAGQGVHLRFEGVSFGFERGRPVLDDVTLEARPGETVALVGPTGAGKSTLVSLLPRFHDVWSGRVTWDGIDVRALQVAGLRAQIALVLQEPFLFPISVAENIAYGRPGATRAEIVAAAQAANADAFIRRLPAGYDTILGEGGQDLSGGERQRLAIARAVLKDAAVLILDEPTSALDAGTEAAVVEALERLMAGRTTFIIAHRLSTIRRADRIAVIENGRVVECGAHDELVARSGLYRRLHTLQVGAPRAEAVA